MVVVCTEKRGVFAGEIAERDGDKRIVLKKARMCVYWSEDTRGVVGLAAVGPTEKCRITRAAPSIELYGITAVMECSEQAAIAWEKEPWSN